ncbi:hypothetical protein OUZ56_016579 [Daphnia magna]|uniref:Uncharacterized protein n=1 Tax=Daphnia magna TaxID=35525 RepID=A0ABR0AQZ7_9CRUS|nr:hypothetical protein OUZ56_016579 [Daphnia magna]
MADFDIARLQEFCCGRGLLRSTRSILLLWQHRRTGRTVKDVHLALGPGARCKYGLTGQLTTERAGTVTQKIIMPALFVIKLIKVNPYLHRGRVLGLLDCLVRVID